MSYNARLTAALQAGNRGRRKAQSDPRNDPLQHGRDLLRDGGKPGIADALHAGQGVDGGKIDVFKVAPENFGLKRGSVEHLRADSPAASARTIMEVLQSKRRDEARSLVVLNAAAALFVGGLAKDTMHAARLAEQSIDSGQAQYKLERLIQTTNK